MAAPGKLYGTLLSQLVNGANLNWASDTIKVLLATSAYTPDQDAHGFRSSVTEIAVVSTTLSSAAAAGATTISATASIGVGNLVLIGGNATRWVTAVSGSGPYTLTLDSALSAAYASGAAVASGTGYTAGGATLASKTTVYTAATNTHALDAADTQLSASGTFGGRYLVIYKSVGSAATDILIAYVDLLSNIACTSGPFSAQWDAAGVVTLTTV